MKILQINKFNYLFGGADKCFLDTIEILKSHGHEVAVFSMSHPNNRPSDWDQYFIDEVDYNKSMSFLRKITVGWRLIYNRQAVKNLEELIKNFNPDVAHVHNVYHQMSPAVINVLKKHNIPIVMTLHDYKVVSPLYSLFLRGKIVDVCKNGRYYECFFRKCIKDSWLKSFLATIEAYLYHNTYRKINLFISPSLFLKKKFRDFGFKERIEHLPYAFIDKVDNTNDKINKEVKNYGKYILFFGRLSVEKGIDVAIRALFALNNKGIKLLIAGEGPEEENLKNLAQNLSLENRVLFVGKKDKKHLYPLIKSAQAVVVPSIWYENLPYSVIETLSLTQIAICANLGGLSNMIKDKENSFLFKAGNSVDLARVINYVLNLTAVEKE
ncbi:group 1 glycosyl transferase, partial [Candidatus Falkowbacteria bacterium CG10_big_fil_rev_8_21_14_0_10_37_6]